MYIRRVYNFVTSWDPMFPNIGKAIEKFAKILEEDEDCREVFPEGCFRIAYLITFALASLITFASLLMSVNNILNSLCLKIQGSHQTLRMFCSFKQSTFVLFIVKVDLVN